MAESWLEALIRQLGGSKKASKTLGVSQRTVQRWVAGTQKPSKRSEEKIQNYYSRREDAEQWSNDEQRLFTAMLEGDVGAYGDTHLQSLFDRAMFDPTPDPSQRQAAYDELLSYLWDEYHIDFEEMFDWEDYREWYETQ